MKEMLILLTARSGASCAIAANVVRALSQEAAVPVTKAPFSGTHPHLHWLSCLSSPGLLAGVCEQIPSHPRASGEALQRCPGEKSEPTPLGTAFCFVPRPRARQQEPPKPTHFGWLAFFVEFVLKCFCPGAAGDLLMSINVLSSRVLSLGNFAKCAVNVYSFV